MQEKTERGVTLGFFNIHSVAKHRKIEGRSLWGIFFKVSQCRKKKLEGETLWSRPVWYATRKNRKNLFGSVRQAKWCNLVQ